MNERERDWAEMMRAAIAGDSKVYERLLGEIAPVLRATVRRRMVAAGIAASECEDVVQETLLAVHLKRHTWRMEDPLGPWLWKIARNKLIDHLRRRGRRVEVPIEDFSEILPAEAERPGTGDSDVERHLALLPAGQRAVLQAVAVDGASIGEAAEKMKMTPGAVRVALHRGFASLAQRLRTEG